jgi:hypothetical protein
MTEDHLTEPGKLEVDFEALALTWSDSSIPGNITEGGRRWAQFLILEHAEAIAQGIFEGRLSGYSKPKGAPSRVAHLVTKYEGEQREKRRKKDQQRRQQSCEEQRQRRNDDSAKRPPKRRTMPRGPKRGRPVKPRLVVMKSAADVLTWEQENGRLLFAEAPQEMPVHLLFTDDIPAAAE